MHYVLSSKVEPGCPLLLTGNAALHDKFYANSEKLNNIVGDYPWYSDSDTCDLPEGLCLITKFKSCRFDIRELSGSLYVVSESFFDVLLSENVKNKGFVRIDAKHSSGKALEKEYFLIRFPPVNSSRK
jgi:hypothetical protein